MPTIAWEYVSPLVLPEDQPALFRVTLGNNVAYYQAGVASDAQRVGWMFTDSGYTQADMIFFCVMASLKEGIVVKANGDPMVLDQEYLEFFRGSHDVLVSVERGPVAYAYPPPILGWKANCGDANGEGKYTWQDTDPTTDLPFYAIGMPVAGRQIVWTETCPAITWSGSVLSNGGAVILAGGPASFDASAVIAAAADTLEPARSSAGLVTAWKVRVRAVTGALRWETFVDMDETSPGVATTTVDLSMLPDGAYEAQAMADCLSGSRAQMQAPGYGDSRTASLLIHLDRTRPAVIHVKTSSGGSTYSSGDGVRIQFSEEVQCTGHLLDGATQAKAVIKVAFAGGLVLDSSTTPPGLRLACSGSVVVAAVTSVLDASSAVGETMRITVSGVYDLAGNAVPDNADATDVLIHEADAGAGRARAWLKEKLDDHDELLDHHDKEMEASLEQAKRFTKLIQDHMGQAPDSPAAPAARLRRADASAGGGGGSEVEFADTLFGQNEQSRKEMAAFQTEAHDDAHAIKEMLMGFGVSSPANATQGGTAGRRARRAAENVQPADNTLFGAKAASRQQMKSFQETQKADWHTIKEIVRHVAAGNGFRKTNTNDEDTDAEGHADDGMDEAVVAGIVVAAVFAAVGLALLAWIGTTKQKPCAPQKVHPDTHARGSVSKRKSIKPRKVSVASQALSVSALGPLAPMPGVAPEGSSMLSAGGQSMARPTSLPKSGGKNRAAMPSVLVTTQTSV